MQQVQCRFVRFAQDCAGKPYHTRPMNEARTHAHARKPADIDKTMRHGARAPSQIYTAKKIQRRRGILRYAVANYSANRLKTGLPEPLPEPLLEPIPHVQIRHDRVQ